MNIFNCFVLPLQIIGLSRTAVTAVERETISFYPRALFRVVGDERIPNSQAEQGLDTSIFTDNQRKLLCSLANLNAVIQFARCNLGHYPNLLSNEIGPGETSVYWVFVDDTPSPNKTVLGFKCKAMFGSHSFLIVMENPTKAIVYISEKWSRG